MEKHNWELQDSKGKVLNGTKKEMEDLFYKISNGGKEIQWSGELKLVQIHNKVTTKKKEKPFNTEWQFKQKQVHIPQN